MSTIARQIEEAYGLSKGSLKAVVFYDTRSWGKCFVYGPAAVEKKVKKDLPTSIVVREKLGDLKLVPEDVNIVDGNNYGVIGKVALAPGYPPDGA